MYYSLLIGGFWDILLCLFIAFFGGLAILLFVLCRKMSKTIKETENTLTKVQDENEKYKRAFPVLKEKIESHLKMIDNFIKLEGCFNSSKLLEQMHENLINNLIWPKDPKYAKGKDLLNGIFSKLKQEFSNVDKEFTKLRLLQERIKMFYDQLEDKNATTDSKFERNIRTKFLELAMVAIDVIESIKNPNFIRSRQGLNLDYLCGYKTFEEILKESKSITTIDDETNLWAQRLQAALYVWSGDIMSNSLIENRPFILNGYKFDFSHK